ncbi:hypothetical protein D3C73_879610 [compost metagenome]
MLGEAGRDQEGAARPAQTQFVARSRIFGPGRRRAAVTDGEVDDQPTIGGVENTRRVVARHGPGLGKHRPVRPQRRQHQGLAARRGEYLHVVVEAGAEEALQLLARQDDPFQHGGQLLHRLHARAAEPQLVPHAARLSQQGVVHACLTFSAAASIRSAMVST